MIVNNKGLLTRASNESNFVVDGDCNTTFIGPTPKFDGEAVIGMSTTFFGVSIGSLVLCAATFFSKVLYRDAKNSNQIDDSAGGENGIAHTSPMATDEYKKGRTINELFWEIVRFNILNFTILVGKLGFSEFRLRMDISML